MTTDASGPLILKFAMWVAIPTGLLLGVGAIASVIAERRATPRKTDNIKMLSSVDFSYSAKLFRSGEGEMVWGVVQRTVPMSPDGQTYLCFDLIGHGNAHVSVETPPGTVEGVATSEVFFQTDSDEATGKYNFVSSDVAGQPVHGCVSFTMMTRDERYPMLTFGATMLEHR